MNANQPILAVFAPDLYHASVTFFWDHIRSIWPGRTVVVHLSSTGQTASLDVPTLEMPMRAAWPEPRWPGISKVFRQINAFRTSAFTHKQQRDIQAFLEENLVTHLFAEFATSGLSVVPLARKLGLPLTVMCHGWDVNVIGQMPQFRLRYKTLYRPDVNLVANGPLLRERMIAIGAPAERIEMVPCAIEADAFRPVTHSENEKVRIVMVSRLIDLKGPLLSLEAFARAAKQSPNIELDIVGDGPLGIEVRKRINSLDVPNAVRWHGAVDHARALEIIAHSDIFLQHCVTIPGSAVETQGVSLLEAMGHGVVPIVTRHGAMAYQVEDGVTGFLVEERDIDAMAERIVSISAAPDLRRAIGKAARSFVLDNFKPSDIYARLRRIIGLTNNGQN